MVRAQRSEWIGGDGADTLAYRKQLQYAWSAGPRAFEFSGWNLLARLE